MGIIRRVRRTRKARPVKATQSTGRKRPVKRSPVKVAGKRPVKRVGTGVSKPVSKSRSASGRAASRSSYKK